MYDPSTFSKEEIDRIIENLKYDKKNSNGQVLFVLLENIGTPVLNQKVANELILDAFAYYHSL